MEQIRFITGILLSSNDPDSLAKFYCETLKVPLEKTEHGGTKVHYECDLGDVHFAIHPLYPGQTNPRNTAARIGFAVFNIADVKTQLEANAVKFYGPQTRDFGTVISLIDPDGNAVDLYEHSADHYQHIEKLRSKFDLLKFWKASK